MVSHSIQWTLIPKQQREIISSRNVIRYFNFFKYHDMQQIRPYNIIETLIDRPRSPPPPTMLKRECVFGLQLDTLLREIVFTPPVHEDCA